MHPLLSPYCQTKLKAEEQIFENEYSQYYCASESKAKTIGQPFLLYNPNASTGILLVHGLMAAPEEVRPLADFLFAQGYTVYAPRMAGHGTSAVDLSKREHGEWQASVQRGYCILEDCCDQVIAAGFSTGAAVIQQLIINKPSLFSALISISAPLRFTKFSAHFASPVNSINQTLHALGLGHFAKPFVTNHADNPHINYLRCPIASIVQIQQLMKSVIPRLHKITLPTLIMHANHDPKVHVKSAKDLYKLIGSDFKQYQEVNSSQHGIIRGDISIEVFAQVAKFLMHISVRKIVKKSTRMRIRDT